MAAKQTRVYARALVALAMLVMLAGCAGRVAVEDRHPDDPWEGFNRSVFTFKDRKSVV